MDTQKGEETSDPVYRLRQLANEHHKKEIKDTLKVQRGGFAILAPLAVGALTAIGSKLSSELYDFVKKRISGNGYKVNHRTKKQKREFLKQFFNAL